LLAERQSEKGIALKEKQMISDRKLAEKKLQFERELKTAEAVERDKQLMIENQLKEKQMQIESAEKDRIRQEERMEKDKEKLKADYEAKLELNKQNLILQSELKLAKTVTTSVGLREPPVAVLVDVGDSVTAATDASFLQKLLRLGSSYSTPVNSSMGSATPMAARTSDLASGYVMSPYTSPITCEKQETSSVTWTSPSTNITQTYTTNSSTAHNGLLTPTYTTLPHAGQQVHTDLHLHQTNHKTLMSQPVVSMNFAQPPSTTANSPIPGPVPVVGQMTTISLQPLTVNQTGLMSRSGQPSAPVVSDVLTQSHSSTTDFDKSSVKVRSLVELPTSAAIGEQVPSPSQPVVIVKQFQKPKPYSGQTSHKSFREHFERVAKANASTTNVEKMQNLALALEGPALECLREVKEDEDEAYEKIWRILARRFGHLDEPERAMRKFDARKQLDGETVAEYEQALRTLYREAWPKADEESKDSALKRNFEEGLSSPDMMQFLRLHGRADDFLQTVAKARRFAEAQEAAKKAVRIVESIDKDHGAEGTVPGQPNLQPLLDGFQKVIQTVLERPPAMATVAAIGDEASSSTRNGKSSGVSCFRNSRSEQQRPQQSGNGGRRAWNNRNGSSSRSRDSTPERGRQNNGGNNRAQGEEEPPRRGESPSPGRGDGNQGYGSRRDFDRSGQTSF